MSKCSCVIYDTMSKIKNIEDSPDLICTNCPLMKEYFKLVDEGKIDFINDVARFNKFSDWKHHSNTKKRRRRKNASGNKSYTNRTLSKSRKKFKDKSKKMVKPNV